MKRIIVPICVALIWCGCGAGKQESSSDQQERALLVQAIWDQAQDMQQLFVEGELDGYIDYMPVNFIEMAGGRTAIEELMQSDMANLGELIEAVSLGEVSEIVQEENVLAAFVPVETLYSFPNGQYLRRSYYVASSEDGGKTWKFLSSQGEPAQENFYRSQYPNLTKKLAFPKCRMEKVGL